MRIGFDISQTGGARAGCGYFAESLIRQLCALDRSNEYVLYPTFGDAYCDAMTARATCAIDSPNVRRRVPHASTDSERQFWRQPPENFEAELGHPDVIHANNFFCPSTLCKARLIYTLYDLSFLAHPEWTTEANRLICFDGVFQASLYADHIIAISEFSRQHFLSTFPHYPAERVSVVYPASRFDVGGGASRASGVPELEADRFWLTVGTIEPRKNLRRLLEAYARVCKGGLTEMPLVLAGGEGWMEEGLVEYATTLGISKQVQFLGYVDDQRLAWLYRSCFALVYPSLFEGFGLPVLEAMGFGAAVITSNVTSVPEIAGDAALLIDPIDIDTLADAMVRLRGDADLHAQLRRRARERARLFSWDNAARAVMRVYDAVS